MAKQSLCSENWQLIYVKNSDFKKDGDFISLENLKQSNYFIESYKINKNDSIHIKLKVKIS